MIGVVGDDRCDGSPRLTRLRMERASGRRAVDGRRGKAWGSENVVAEVVKGKVSVVVKGVSRVVLVAASAIDFPLFDGVVTASGSTSVVSGLGMMNARHLVCDDQAKVSGSTISADDKVTASGSTSAVFAAI